MLRVSLLALGLLQFFRIPAQDKPKLVVGVVIDQMRNEYLSRFENHFGDKGFKRLINEGFRLENAHFNYVPTETAPGHASIYSGTTPRHHGIMGNDWYDVKLKRKMYCVEDTNVSAVGGEHQGQRSPNNLLTSTITDELRLFYQMKAKVVSVSIKDRGAILPAGHFPNGAYWYDHQSGGFMTSTHYKASLPEWVKQFNELQLPKQYMSKKWETVRPIESYVESGDDMREYERSLQMGEDPVFPYDLKKISKSQGANGLIASTPYGNSLVLDMALAALDGEELGRDNIPDFLAISFSSTDYIGHAYGPYSKEIQDTYIRMDMEIERLLNKLDEKVGKGNYLIFLTADHAVADIPRHLIREKYNVGYWSVEDLESGLSAHLANVFGTAGVLSMIEGNQLFFNKPLLAAGSLNFKDVKQSAIDFLIGFDGIAGAYDVSELFAYQGGHHDLQMISAGLHLKRSGDVVFTELPGWLDNKSEKNGTTHRSFYAYDTHVPMIFYGTGIGQGRSCEYHPITDIAPTVSMLLDIKLPSGCTGEPITEVLTSK